MKVERGGWVGRRRRRQKVSEAAAAAATTIINKSNHIYIHIRSYDKNKKKNIRWNAPGMKSCACMDENEWMNETSGNSNDDACECDHVLSYILLILLTDSLYYMNEMYILCTLYSRVYVCTGVWE